VGKNATVYSRVTPSPKESNRDKTSTAVRSPLNGRKRQLAEIGLKGIFLHKDGKRWAVDVEKRSWWVIRKSRKGGKSDVRRKNQVLLRREPAGLQHIRAPHRRKRPLDAYAGCMTDDRVA